MPGNQLLSIISVSKDTFTIWSRLSQTFSTNFGLPEEDSPHQFTGIGQNGIISQKPDGRLKCEIDSGTDRVISLWSVIISISVSTVWSEPAVRVQRGTSGCLLLSAFPCEADLISLTRVWIWRVLAYFKQWVMSHGSRCVSLSQFLCFFGAAVFYIFICCCPLPLPQSPIQSHRKHSRLTQSQVVN